MLLGCLVWSAVQSHWLSAAGQARGRQPSPRIRLPAKGYRDLRDSLTRGLLPARPSTNRAGPAWTDWEGNEAAWADVLHHSRYNLEELLLPGADHVPELLDRIRLEQARLGGEDLGSSEEGIIARARASLTPYSSHPEEELRIKLELERLGYFGE